MEWRYLLTLGLADNEEAHEDLDMQIIPLILKTFTPLALSIWKAQNQVLDKARLRRKIRQGLAEIEDMYENPKMVPSAERHRCDKVLEEILKCTASLHRHISLRMRL
jgi:hypothetical protein